MKFVVDRYDGLGEIDKWRKIHARRYKDVYARVTHRMKTNAVQFPTTKVVQVSNFSKLGLIAGQKKENTEVKTDLFERLLPLEAQEFKIEALEQKDDDDDTDDNAPLSKPPTASNKRARDAEAKPKGKKRQKKEVSLLPLIKQEEDS